MAAACALMGSITDPRALGTRLLCVLMPPKFFIDDSLILPPFSRPKEVVIERGPNIQPLPTRGPIEDFAESSIILKIGDNITTDDILPAGAKVLPLRFKDPDKFQRIQQGDQLTIKDIRNRLKENGFLKVENEVSDGLKQREKEILLSGGLLNHTRDRKAHGTY